MEGCKSSRRRRVAAWNTGCWLFKTHGVWMRVGECGLVDEVVEMWNKGGRVE